MADRPEALLFDVQGTATEFHASVSDALRTIDEGRHPGVSWEGVVDRWRAAYFVALEESRPTPGQDWGTVHSVYRSALDPLLAAEGVIGWTDSEREEATDAWRRLPPWPDTVPGLTRLRTRFTVATLSNADVGAVVEMSKRGGLPWDAVFTAEMAGVFKPDPRIYRMAARYLGFPPARIMMVASHKYDLRAAARLGFRTAFVARPLEFGPHGVVDTTYESDFDVNAADFLDLADQLGC
ncbi:haloacid dehalogenase type II [Rhodococcus spongiicola]|uniref:Haloacid dehalogenase type II n=1 Tax=Rhodococcus spongiicola TaxID=2487352 RepID=A0A3S3ZP34_9NOCA|nr:haloacid dehalogenase type II [Rhodococcus spongiicola]RVW05063.1 haloacid dehalogenase type II [Rhodococcus spongiicola]